MGVVWGERGRDGRVLHDKGVREVEGAGCLLKGGFRSRIENQACQGPANQGDKCSTPTSALCFLSPTIL